MSNLPNSQMVTLAIGATIGVLGAASLFIYQKLMEQRERENMMNNLENVNKRVTDLQVELENLRTQQNISKSRKLKNSNRTRITSISSNHTSAETANEIDALSVAETDMDDEFYDCSDDELSSGDLEMNGTPGIMTELTKQLDALDAKMENELSLDEVLCDLRSLAVWHENNIEVAWRLARACFKNASHLTDQAQQEVLAQEGIKACEKFLDDKHVDLHKYYALLVGFRTEYLPTKEKLVGGKLFEKHVKIALEMRPHDPTLNYLLGRFQYTVSGLSWFEKKICETLFGEAPSATYDEALTSLENADKHTAQPDLEIKFYLGQAYIKTKSYKKGVEALGEVCKLKSSAVKQEKMQTEAKSLVSKYSKYC